MTLLYIVLEHRYFSDTPHWFTFFIMASTPSTKDVVKKYFTEGADDIWTCQCNKKRKKGRGWANLMDHIQRDHPDSLEKARKIDCGPIEQFFSKKDTNLFNWVEWIVTDLLPFTFL
jgi:hypothetical protein